MGNEIEEITKSISIGQNIDSLGLQNIVQQILSNEIELDLVRKLLKTISQQPLKTEILSSFVKAVMNYCYKIESKSNSIIIDTCGTGGDGKNIINLSTMSAILISSILKENNIEATVVKHGNRSATSTCGSADILEKSGTNLFCSPEEIEDIVNNNYFAFCFAPIFHPILKNVSNIRKEMGIPTIFNYLGPLCHPIESARRCIGVPDDDIAKVMAEVLLKNKLVSKSSVYSTSSKTSDIIPGDLLKIYSIQDDNIMIEEIDTFEITNQRIKYQNLSVDYLGDPFSVFKNTLTAKNNTNNSVSIAVALNAGIALKASGIIDNISKAYNLCLEKLNTGTSYDILEEYNMILNGLGPKTNKVN